MDNDSSVSSIPKHVEERSLLEEIQEVLAQSYLIFLLSDLRLMSGTGRIGTKFETIALDSDFWSKTTAAQLAGLDTIETREADKRTGEGLSPAHIMAVLLLELKKTADEVRRLRVNWNGNDASSDDAHFIGYRNDRKERRTVEESMESLLRAYSRMIANDLCAKVPYMQRRCSALGGMSSDDTDYPHTPRRRSVRDLMLDDGDYNNTGHARKQLNSIAENPNDSSSESKQEEDSNVEQNEPSRNQECKHDETEVRAIGDTTLNEGNIKGEPISNGVCPIETDKVEEVHEGGRLQNLEVDVAGNTEIHSSRKAKLQALARQIREKRSALAAEMRNRRIDLREEAAKFFHSNQEELTKQEFKELTDILFSMGGSSLDVQSSIGVKSSKELMLLMKKAVESRQHGKLRFMSKLFTEGSISQLMAESPSRIVWMNDWYPLKDLTYAIAVDQALKRVLVVFRGAITKADWKAVTTFSKTSVPNPVTEYYEGRSPYIKVYRGFYQYLFRKRRDTGTTKYDEIANMAEKYGREKIGSDFRVLVTGHSLGAALTIFFSLYASTEERFTKNGPVKAITFGGPYCGGHKFADTFRHQERNGKLQLVRVFNDNDCVPHLPFNFKLDKRGCYWRHVGIEVKIPTVPSGFCLRYVCFWKRWWRPRVSYWGKEKGWFSSLGHGIRNNILLNYPWGQPLSFHRVHTLFELQDRLMYGTKIRNRGGEYALLEKTLDELYNLLQQSDFTTLQP